ncbi:MAG: hypothetical protein ILP19_06790 [Oscillospiraceae bacterium]|nr:hypothetical protein [Oscillospiraceae bacterium]
MLSFKCRTCGGEMSVSKSGDLVCSYCGSKYTFTDKDLSAYREFRLKMLYYLSAQANREEYDTEEIWSRASEASFMTADGSDISVRFVSLEENGDTAVYTARNNVIITMPPDKADRYEKAVTELGYPSADTRKLSQYFPVITGRFLLRDGRAMLAAAKPEAVFPLSLFGSLPPVHAAWILSRLENICCVLEYSGMTHGGIDTANVFINAATHEAYLLGGWEKAVKTSDKHTDLIMIRQTAERVMGKSISEAPDMFREFLKKRSFTNAYDDFADWDRVIEQGFNGRRFVKLDLTNI